MEIEMVVALRVCTLSIFRYISALLLRLSIVADILNDVQNVAAEILQLDVILREDWKRKTGEEICELPAAVKLLHTVLEGILARTLFVKRTNS